MSKKRKPRTSSPAESEGEVLTRPGPAGLGGGGRWFTNPLVPALLAVLASLNSLWDDFAIDDAQLILNNQLIKDLRNIPFAFTNSGWSFASSDIVFTVDSYYRPLFSVLLSINYSILGKNAWGWHLVNVVIHAGVTLLVFKVVLELTEQRWVSVASACLFAVHPAHAESVAWISGVTDPLMALLVLPGFYFYLRYRKTGRKHYVALTLVACFLALLCKETALALPPIVLYCELIHVSEQASLKQRLRQAVILGLGFSLPTGLYFVMRYLAIGSVLFGTGSRYPLRAALMTIPLALAKYIKLMVLPWGYSYQHLTYFVESIASTRFLVPLALLAALAICIALTRSKLLLFSAVWFVVWLGPPLAALRQFDPEYMVQERYLYLPSVGFCLAAGLGIQWLATRTYSASTGKRLAVAVLCLIVAIWGGACFAQNRVWNNTNSVLRNCVAIEPFSGRAYSAISQNYFVTGNTREAEACARKAIELDPQFAGGYLSLGYVSKQGGKLDQAIDYLEQARAAIQLSPATRKDLATVHVNLGLLYSERKNPAQAEKNLLRSVELWPRAVGTYNLGMFYLAQGRYEAARDALEQAAGQAPPRYAPLRASLGAVYDHLGDVSRACAEYSRYLELALPNAPDRAGVQQRFSAVCGERREK